MAEAEEQLSNFIQCKAELSRPLNDCEAIDRGCVVAPLPANSLRRRQQANPLVITNGGRPESNLPRYVGNQLRGHGYILERCIWVSQQV